MKVQLKIDDNLVETYSIHEGQTAEEVAKEISSKYNLAVEIKEKIQEEIEIQLKGSNKL
jgi:nucleotidyltransferase/DNA polymerase involved in DNA repair